MDFAFTKEQDELRAVVGSFLADKSSEAAVRAAMASDRGYDEAVWRQMAEQLGLQGLAIPESYGGAGYTMVELGAVFEEMGRALLCAPFLTTVALASNVLLTSEDDGACADYLPGIAAGETIATLALTEDSGRWDTEAVTLAASREGQGWHLSGTKTYVPDGHVADLVLVVARTGSGLGLFVVDVAAAAGFDAELLPTMDQTRKQARLGFDRTPARLVGSADGWTAIGRGLDLAAVALAAEQVGGAAAALDMSVDYAKVREQFGRPIGSFQAVKHKCSDMLVEVEAARSAAYYGMWAAAAHADDLPAAASLAKAYCSEAFTLCAGENIQIHGGIGFTWEHPAHLYFKRAKSSEVLLGSPAYHREVLADRVGIGVLP